MAAYEVLLLNTTLPQIQAAQSGDTYVVPRDITFSTNATFTTGTANGVMYLNGDKVVSTGSLLTFNGTTFTAPSLSLTNALSTTSGGTGLSSFTAGDLTYYSTGTALSKLAIGTANQVLTSSGTAPQWTSLSSIGVTSVSFGSTGLTPSSATAGAVSVAGTLVTSNGGTGLSSYTAGDLVYYSTGTALSKLAIGTASQILTSSGSAPQWSTASGISVGTATNLAGGAAGSVPYQSGAGATTFLSIGAANRVLTSTGSVPQWVTSLTGLTGVSSSSITNTALTSGRVVYSTTGGAQTDSANLTFDGTTLTAGGFSGPLNGTVGATTANTGAFTTLSASSTVTLSGGTANGVLYLNGSKAATSGSALTFDGTNLGLGATPSAWNSDYRSLAVSNYAEFYGRVATPAVGVAYNAYRNSGGSWIYKTTNAAATYEQDSGFHIWNTAASGTAGNAITFTQAMTLNSSGNLGIGTSSPATKLEAVGVIRASSGTGQLNIGITGGIPYIQGYDSATAGNRQLAFYTGTEVMRLDASGNLGLGVTPSAWSSGYAALQLPNGGAFWSVKTGSPTVITSANAYFDGTSYKYLASYAATLAIQSGGQHQWYTAPSGTAGTNISFTQAMTLDASGNLGIGTSSPLLPLHVVTTGTSTSAGGNIAATFRSGASGRAVTLQFSDGTVATWVGQVSGSNISFGTSNVEAMRLDSSGNLGLGVTPSAWGSAFKAIQVGNQAAFATDSGVTADVVLNAHQSGSNWIYKANGNATLLRQESGAYKFFTAASGTAGTNISFTQAMTLDASGNLLVGTTSSTGISGAAFKKGAATSCLIELSGGNGTPATDSLAIGQDGSNIAYVYQRANQALILGTNNTERARVTSGGDFQLGTGGTASANVRSIINGSSTTGYGGYIEFQNNGAAFAAVGDYKALGGGGSTALLLCKNSTGGVYLATSGATSWSAVSDENKKNIIENISDAAAKVSSLRAVIGTYKDDPNAERHPFLIAQDVKAVLPEAVTDNEGVLGLSYSDVIPLLVAAIKEQQALITALTARIAALESKGV